MLNSSPLDQLDVGHLGAVSAVAYSPDGTLLATRGFDRSLILWELSTGAMRRRATLSDPYGHHLAFSPDGKSLLVDDGLAQIWDVAGWMPRLSLLGRPPFAFVGNDSVVCTASDRFFQIDLATGRLLNEALFGPDPYDRHWHTAMSPDGKLAVTTTKFDMRWDEAHEYAVWDLTTWSLRFRRKALRKPKALRKRYPRYRTWHQDVVDLAVSPDGCRFVITANDWSLTCDASNGRILRVLISDPDSIARGAELSADGRALAVANEDHDGAFVSLFKMPSGQMLRRIPTEGSCAPLAFSPDSRQFATGGDVLRFWNTATGEPEGKLRAMEYEATAVIWSDRMLLAGYSDGSVRVWDPFEGSCQEQLVGDGKAIRQIVLDANPTSDAEWRDIGRIRMGHLSLLLLHQLSDDDTEVIRALNADGTFHAAVVRGDQTGPRRAEVRRFPSGELVIAARLQNSEYPDCLCLSDDGATLATGDYDNGVYLTDLRTGKPLSQPHLMTSGGEEIAWRYTPGPVSAITFSPDGRCLWAGSKGGEIWMWDLTLEKSPDWFHDEKHGIDLIIEAHADAIRGIAFSPDGQWMATASADATVKIWRTSDWQLHATLIVLPDADNKPSDATKAIFADAKKR